MENLVNLPILVLKKILNNLKSAELKALRATCRTFNSMINQPEYLKGIKTYIKSKDQLEDLVAANCKLDIYNIVYDCWDHPSLESKQKFIDKFKSTLCQIKFKIFAPKFIELLGEDNLESLSISTSSYFTDMFIEEILKASKFNNLNKLKIKLLDDKFQDLFEIFLKKSPNLKHIRVPIWQSVPRTTAFRRSKSISCQPLINFIAKSPNNLTIDFGGFGSDNCENNSLSWPWLCSIRDTKINTAIFPITPTILLQICERPNENDRGLKLRNVQLNSLPDKSELTTRQKSNLDDCIQSIVMIRPDQNYDQKYFPSKAEIKVGIFDLGLGLSNKFEFKFDPKLNITSVYWRVVGEFKMCHSHSSSSEKRPSQYLNLVDSGPSIYQNLFKNKPIKLLKYYIYAGQPIYVGDALINIKLDVWAKFPNLKVLYLIGDYEFRRRVDEVVLKLEF